MIVVSGERRKVASWSLKDGCYYEGLDSVWLVHSGAMSARYGANGKKGRR